MVAGTGTESRRSFTAGEALMLPPLHELAGVAKVAQPREGRRTEVRYDTTDRALKRHGFRLSRITDHDGGARWELSAVSLDPSTRVSAGQDAGIPPEDAVIPPELMEDVQAVARGRELLPAETLTTSFLDYGLLDGTGAVLGSVTDERVVGSGPDTPGSGRRVWVVRAGDEGLAEAAEAVLLAAGAAMTGPGTAEEPELEQAGPDTAGTGAVPLTTDGPVSAVLLQYLRAQFDELLRHEPRVRRGEADGIHKMRVATRRLRSALSSYRSTMDPEPGNTLREELRWLAGVLGQARDAQVMRHRLQQLIADEPGDLVMGPVAARVDEELLYEYRQAYGQIREALHSRRYFQALDALEALVDGPSWTGTAREPAGPASARMIRRDRKRLHRRVRAARTQEGEAYAEALHDARKDAKRLRYAAEVWGLVQPKEAKVMVDAAEHVQKILGEHQDSVVTQGYLRRMGATASAAGENGFTYGRLHALEQVRARAAQERFDHAWKGFPSKP
ncbi:MULTISPECIES: CHAD domain-containing protein [unclassified Arthrobacter]|uniref:CHAD domain-containing protein n=1 Tax=unclassified Arthrobacter TaxID=235627 RepID=UPI001E59D3B3|nr:MULTISPECIES: CHAD domain-containing protein [unclassified Arthrobacter]MCC9145822.1 CHAD domain-containing protein [Arthrobacter sp. zg-Y919]MDK1277051.1 CHAD domain-containing protein [Arthrobacter sp. zg.Y919]WIB03579.1 CHAD domain-containing protein [Arthrobacter sp. zg-Y919]